MAFNRELNLPGVQQYESLGKQRAHSRDQDIGAIATAARGAILNKDATALEHLDNVLGTAGLSSAQANMVKGLVATAIYKGQSEFSQDQFNRLSQLSQPMGENRLGAIERLEEAARNLVTAKHGGPMGVTPAARDEAARTADVAATSRSTEQIDKIAEKVEANTVYTTTSGSEKKFEELTANAGALPKLAMLDVNDCIYGQLNPCGASNASYVNERDRNTPPLPRNPATNS